ncbi:hypothetical protein [Bradyrhizobium frederickii]|uniref:hypothetical protein n=1 Tax=Bradyrhizobium frederickii TaxID=2560054 RepID=UPI001F2F9D55|nr:hypothetical protein [Bradyrhizobium frederickii]
MNWLIAFAFFGSCWWSVARARERASELAANGIGRSPLYWMSNALVATLLAFVLYIAHIHHDSPVPAFLWFVAGDHRGFTISAPRVEIALPYIAYMATTNW